METWQIILLVVATGGALFLFMALLGTRKANHDGKEAAVILARIEEKYDQFMRSRLNLALIGKDTSLPEEDALVEEALEYLQGDILGLIAHINASQYTLARTKHNPRLLSNIPPVVNHLFEKSRGTPDHRLNKSQEQELFLAYRNGIQSHVKKRLLDIETGNALEDL